MVARGYPDEIRTTGVRSTLTAGFVDAMISPSIVAIPLGHSWTPAHIMLAPRHSCVSLPIGILYAVPLAVGSKTTRPQPAVKTATYLEK